MREVHNFNKRVILFEVVYAWVCLFVKLEFFEEEFYYYYFFIIINISENKLFGRKCFNVERD